ncbi:MAG: hypothetical protein MK105_09525 [Crocinitomicaceae bacterium]|nr:hypothetical protein [Crocinitomicaceae bacterium]
MLKKKDHKIELQGADKFILALEKHDKHKSSTGNTCQYILEVDSEFNLKSFIKAVESNEIVHWLSGFQLAVGLKNSNHWKTNNQPKKSVKVTVYKQLYNSSVHRQKINPIKDGLFNFEVFNSEGKIRTIVFTWHHLLMDGYGAGLLIQNLITPFNIEPSLREKSKINWETLKQAVQARRFVSSSSKGNIGILPSKSSTEIKQTIRMISFSEKETKLIETNARSHGAIFGPSSYFLAATSIAVQELRKNKGLDENDLWIPVPQSSRKKGEKWPLIGNHLSFLFYRLEHKLFEDKTLLTKDITRQMMEQIKSKNGIRYNHLMNYLRPIPSSVYSRMIKGPNGDSLSSFLFTVASDNNASMKSFFGGKIINQLSIPPNTFPPGLTFAFNYFDGRLTVIVQSYEHILNLKESNTLENSLRQLLN